MALTRQVNVKAEFQTISFHLRNVWHYIGKHLSLLILFTMHKRLRSNLVTTVVVMRGTKSAIIFNA